MNLAMFSTPDLIVILVIALLLFGGTKIPQLARSLGQGISEFKKGVNEGQQEPAKPAGPAADKKA